MEGHWLAGQARLLGPFQTCEADVAQPPLAPAQEAADSPGAGQLQGRLSDSSPCACLQSFHHTHTHRVFHAEICPYLACGSYRVAQPNRCESSPLFREKPFPSGMRKIRPSLLLCPDVQLVGKSLTCVWTCCCLHTTCNLRSWPRQVGMD